MNFPAYWSDTLRLHASDPDSRKNKDRTESPRHFIDIDAYPEFVANGFINPNYDSVVFIHGSSFVITQGTVPWAIITWEDSLRRTFQQRNWHMAMQLGADLGHYVGDAHQPLHITENYDGDMSNQSGVHSRYETSLVGQYQTSIVYSNDTASYVPNVSNYTFNFLYNDYQFVDSVLYGDSVAHSVAGSTSGAAYLTKYWELAGNYTINLMKNSSKATADLIYTAWVDAGSPDPNGTTPVELTSFTATGSNNNKILLKWSTASELNNRCFEIERKLSTSNENFRTISFVNGTGTSTIVTNYSFTDNPSINGNYLYRLKQVDFSGTFKYSNIIEASSVALSEFGLNQNYPNPFNPATLIKYSIAKRGNVTLKVYNVLGKEAAVLVNGEKEAGNYEINFNASGLSSGVYFYELSSAGSRLTKKMIIMK
jgi:hypothetical protein